MNQPVDQLIRIIDELRKSNEENIHIMKQTLSEEMKQTNEEMKQTNEEMKQSVSDDLDEMQHKMLWIMFGMSCIVIIMLLILISRAVVKQSY